jgi:hypothetical protein
MRSVVRIARDFCRVARGIEQLMSLKPFTLAPSWKDHERIRGVHRGAMRSTFISRGTGKPFSLSV